MRVVIINKSDATGGAAVVSRRLMEALRDEGVDARMLVCEKLTDSPFIETAASKKVIFRNFFLERLKIFTATGLNKKNLFKIDTGAEGISLWKTPLVKDADAILINWVNQGMLSLKGLKKILKLGKPVICTMHDMWWMTGICHHAGRCQHFQKKCGDCPLLERFASSDDLSRKVWEKKNRIFTDPLLNQKMIFVAVSSWLKEKSKESSLLKHRKLEVIPNAFKLRELSTSYNGRVSSPIRLLFGAARLDDSIKGLDTFREATKFLKEDYPDISRNLEIVLFGSIKDTTNLEGFGLPVKWLGMLHGDEEVRKVYEESHILVSASSYETLPGTLVEAQAYGCIPVSFNQGGQSDIVESEETGFIVSYEEDMQSRARNLAEGIVKAYETINNSEKYRTFITKMKANVAEKFSYSQIAVKYISLIKAYS